MHRPPVQTRPCWRKLRGTGAMPLAQGHGWEVAELGLADSKPSGFPL